MHLQRDKQEQLLLVVYIQLKFQLTIEEYVYVCLANVTVSRDICICSYHDINLGDI